jgi:hypothetical protein
MFPCAASKSALQQISENQGKQTQITISSLGHNKHAGPADHPLQVGDNKCRPELRFALLLFSAAALQHRPRHGTFVPILRHITM